MPDDRNQFRKHMPLTEAHQFAVSHGLQAGGDEIRNMKIEWDRSATSVKKGYMVKLLQENGLFDEYIVQYWPYGATPSGRTRWQWYLSKRGEYEQFLRGEELLDSEEWEEAIQEDVADEASRQQFALEAHLRDFLGKHLETIEPGLRLHSHNGSTGIEFPVDNGRIDILAVDTNGKYVVIELKLSRGRNPVIGQLLYYMAWVDENLGNGPCRGLIVAGEIPPDLRLAVRRAEGVSLAQYHMQFSLERIAN